MTRGAGGRFPVDADGAGLRLDAFVARHLGESAVAARRLIAGAQVRIDGRLAAKGARLAAGAVVTVTAFADAGQPIVADPSVVLTWLYEDDALVAIDKPAGVPSHPLRAGERGTAASGIVARYPECAGASPDPREGGLAHRLDTATSGVLIAARTRGAWSALRDALGAADCEKRYLAEVRGAPPATGAIDADIGRRGRRGRTVRTDGGGRGARAAETRWRVIERRDGTTLVEARLHAGRAHQVRAHLAAAGFPIVGDDRYGVAGDARPDARPERRATAVGAEAPPPHRLHLHASVVTLRHPLTGAPLVIEAGAPIWAGSSPVIG